jgi:hypothetical protein
MGARRSNKLQAPPICDATKKIALSYDMLPPHFFSHLIKITPCPERNTAAFFLQRQPDYEFSQNWEDKQRLP